MLTLNESALGLVSKLLENPNRYRCAVSQFDSVRIIDCGSNVLGGLETGLLLARICLADLAQVALLNTDQGVQVQVFSDHPVSACLASQYAGWQIKVGNYFAMGSGPIRAAACREPLFQELKQTQEMPPCAIGVLETATAPTPEVFDYLYQRLPKSVQDLYLLFAPTKSLAGTIQVVARSLETALHKLHTLHFDLQTIVSGFGSAPLPPVAHKTLDGIGRTNDAILYGGKVILWVRCADEMITQIGPQVPSVASTDYGTPFAEILTRYNGDFYKIDPLLFSPAVVEFHNLQTGRVFTYGQMAPQILKTSFGLGNEN